MRFNETLAELVFRPLSDRGIAPTVVDVGARNGIVMPSSYAKRADLIGFEPNPDEYQKLPSHDTDAERAGVPVASFRSERYHNCALWNKNVLRPFYVTTGPGACTLLGATDKNVTTRMYLEGNERPYEELHTEILDSFTVQCRMLDDVVGCEQKIDILKLDAEGAELRVLQGAMKNLDAQNILFIKTEFVFFPYYCDDHPVFGDQHVVLNEKGFRLLDVDLNQSRYTWGKTTIQAVADRRLVYAGDAYFAIDPDRVTLSPVDLHRLAIAALVFGFNSFSASLLREAALLSGRELNLIEGELGRVDMKRRLKQLWINFPNRVAHVFGLMR